MDQKKPPDPGKDLMSFESNHALVVSDEPKLVSSCDESDAEENKYVLAENGFYREIKTPNDCKNINCTAAADDKLLVCTKCKKGIHYKCSHLPAYQIALFLSKNYRKRFICESCVTYAYPELAFKLTQDSTETIHAIKTESESLRQNLKDVKKHYNCLQDQMDRLKEEKNQLIEKRNLQNTEIKRLSNEVERLLDEKQKLKNSNIHLKEQSLSCMTDLNIPSTADKEIKDKKVAFADQSTSASQNTENTLSITAVNQLIESKFDNFLIKINTLMDQKCNPETVPKTVIDISADSNDISWSSVVSRPQSIKSLMHEARNEERIEVSEKKRRACNIIIHGAVEIGNSPEEIKKEDSGYVKEIFTKLGINLEPSSIQRLGNESQSKNRPIKIVLKNKEDKDKIMKNLNRLKGTERYFGKISVKDDYTSTERGQIRLLTEQAKKLSTENTDKIFKVRGNSKNGWRVVSFQKK